MTAARRVIINSDDFALSPGVSRGIVEAWRDGVLTSTTMLTNLDHFEDGVAVASENPEMPLGIHLTLLWGKPVLPAGEVPSLVDRNGFFPRTLGQIARRYVLRRIRRDDIRRELDAQIKKFKGAGLTPTHVDTHKHVQCLWDVADVISELCAEHGIPHMRCPREEPLPKDFGVDVSRNGRRKADFLRLMCRRHPNLIASRGLTTTDHFVGVQVAKLDAHALMALLAGARPGVTEIMCHVGHADAPSVEWSKRPPDRESELQALRDPRVRQVADDQGIELISYRELS